MLMPTRLWPLAVSGSAGTRENGCCNVILPDGAGPRSSDWRRGNGERERLIIVRGPSTTRVPHSVRRQLSSVAPGRRERNYPNDYQTDPGNFGRIELLVQHDQSDYLCADDHQAGG